MSSIPTHYRAPVLATFLAITVCVFTVSGADWPQFRGPDGLGVSDSTGVPLEFGPDKNVVWKTSLPPGHSSPVLTEDRIFLTAYDDGALLTLCLDRETGKILWRRESARPRQEHFQQTHGPASPSPVTDGTNVYVFFGDFGLLSYGPDGEERWRLPLGPFDNANGHGSSPIVADGMVILICDSDHDSYVIAVDQKTGNVRWKTARPEVSRGYATAGIFRPKDGPAEVIVPGAYVIISYELATGKKLWWVTGMAWQLKSVPIVDGDTIYINGWEIWGDPGEEKPPPPPFAEVVAKHDANEDGVLSHNEAPDPSFHRGNTWNDTDFDGDGVLDEGDWELHIAKSTARNNIIAVRPQGRRGDISDTSVLWRHRRGLPNTPSPLLYNDVLWLVKDGGIATSLDPKTGKMIKQARLPDAIDKYWASPVAADGKIYMTNAGCQVSVLKPEGEWEVLALNQFEDQCFATPAIVDGRIYFRTMGALYCLGKR